MSNDPLGLSSAMRKAYDFIKKNGHATGVHAIARYTAVALADRGLIELLWVPTGVRENKEWIALPLGGTKPRKYKLPAVVAAKPQTVSRTLGLGKDEDGNLLAKSERVMTSDGEKRTGGYHVAASGTDGLVLVSWATPDGMDLVKAVELRPQMLKLYAKVLRESNFFIREDYEHGVLYVSR